MHFLNCQISLSAQPPKRFLSFSLASDNMQCVAETHWFSIFWTGDQWLIDEEGMYFLGPYEDLVEKRSACVLTEEVRRFREWLSLLSHSGKRCYLLFFLYTKSKRRWCRGVMLPPRKWVCKVAFREWSPPALSCQRFNLQITLRKVKIKIYFVLKFKPY